MADPFKTRLKEVETEIEKADKELKKLQEELRNDVGNVELRQRVQRDKLAFIALTDEKAELQRAISRQAGGTQHRVE